MTSNKEKKASLLSYRDCESLKETIYLLRSPVMTKRLIKAIGDIKAGRIIKRGLVDS